VIGKLVLKLLRQKYHCCPRCGSPFVCWNWIHVEKDKFNQMNPHQTPRTTDLWDHECWGLGQEKEEWSYGCGCIGHLIDDYSEVKDGMPHKLASLLFIWFIDNFSFFKKLKHSWTTIFAN
jgi:hypothetical protein